MAEVEIKIGGVLPYHVDGKGGDSFANESCSVDYT
jgi:hypothetical protein